MAGKDKDKRQHTTTPTGKQQKERKKRKEARKEQIQWRLMPQMDIHVPNPKTHTISNTRPQNHSNKQEETKEHKKRGWVNNERFSPKIRQNSIFNF
jgi:hypothetical protein